MVCEAVVGPIDSCGHGHVPVVDVVLGHFGNLILLLLFWEDIARVVLLRRETRDIERAGWSSSMGNVKRR